VSKFAREALQLASEGSQMRLKGGASVGARRGGRLGGAHVLPAYPSYPWDLGASPASSEEPWLERHQLDGSTCSTQGACEGSASVGRAFWLATGCSTPQKWLGAMPSDLVEGVGHLPSEGDGCSEHRRLARECMLGGPTGPTAHQHHAPSSRPHAVPASPRPPPAPARGPWVQ
jgi:hypothetical protein